MNLKSKSIGLVFSGGGSKGLAHAGVIKYLEEKNIKPTQMAGTSAGSIVGALYSWGKTPEEIADMTGKNLKKVQSTNTLNIQDVLKGTYILRVINKENKVYHLKLIKNYSIKPEVITTINLAVITFFFKIMFTFTHKYVLYKYNIKIQNL